MTRLRMQRVADERPLARAAWLTAPPTQQVLDALEADGQAVRFVGGCVRDTLLDPHLDAVDLDIATPVLPARNLELLAAAGIRSVPTGLAHGTITALAEGRAFEVTTLRRDVATDGRWAEVAFTDCFTADAARRDLTINAMSCDRAGRLFDPFDGRADLAAGRIRFVGEPLLRIREDYLRILRFLRFFARFGGERPDPAVLQALEQTRGGLDQLSGERLRAELLKLLMAPMVEASLALAARTGVWRQLFAAEPRLEPFAALRATAPEAGPIVRLAVLLRGAADVEAAARRLRLSNDERDRLVDLATAELPALDLPPAALRRLAYLLGGERLRDRLLVAAAEAGVGRSVLAPSVAAIDSFTSPTLPVSGHDLLALGVPAGPALGARLRALEELWLASDFAADREQLLAELRRDAGDPPTRDLQKGNEE
jgi:poly(A) polymerase